MATIKRYTDISQSKILDEILSSKGADMCFKCLGEETYDLTLCEVSYTEWAKEYKEMFDKAGLQLIPCWSLAALISVLPNNENISITLSKGEYTNNWFAGYGDETDGLNNCITSADNPVDACVKMIEKLHKRNLL